MTPPDDALPGPLSDWFSMCVSEVSRANAMTVRSYRTNVETYLQTLGAYVQMTDSLQSALNNAGVNCRSLAEAIERRGVFATLEDPTIGKARERASKSSDDLRRVLATARPNDRARALGNAW